MLSNNFRGLWQHSFCGKLEKGETIAEAAIRELEEESGLQVMSTYHVRCWVSGYLNSASQVLPQNLEPQGYFEYEFIDRSHCPVTHLINTSCCN